MKSMVSGVVLPKKNVKRYARLKELNSITRWRILIMSDNCCDIKEKEELFQTELDLCYNCTKELEAIVENDAEDLAMEYYYERKYGSER